MLKVGYFLLLCLTTAFSFESDNLVEQNFTWKDLNRIVKDSVDAVANPSRIKDSATFLVSLGLSSGCISTIASSAFAVRNSERWVFEMLDATGKIPSGILEGTVMDFGSYDECLRIRVNGSDGEMFRGRYCMVGYANPLVSPLYQKTQDGRSYVEAYGEPPEWAKYILLNAGGYLKRIAFWFGTCVPSSCTQEDVLKLSSVVSKSLGFKATVSDCQVDEVRAWPTHVIAGLSALCLLVGTSIVGTLLDAIYRARNRERFEAQLQNERWYLKVPIAFSLYSNTVKLFSTGDGNCSLDFFHGIRFLSATWIILGHTYFYTDTWKYLKYRHLLGVHELFNRHWPGAVLENFTIPVSSFFYMSGFLLVYTNWTKLENTNGKLNLVVFFIHKYWRMTPALLLTIAAFLTMPIIDSGPVWNSTLDPPINVCINTWWMNLLYINNWWKTDEFCLLHTWYLASLMQFHIVGILLILLAFRWPKLGLISGIAIAMSCGIITIFLMVKNDFPMPAPAMVKDMDIIENYTSDIYIKPFTHITTYMIGMVAARILLMYKERPKFQVWKLSVFWVLSVTCGLLVVYGLYSPWDAVGIRAAYVATHRIGWALSMGWLTYACANGFGGIVNQILSWKAFAPLGQLSYLAYLLHPLVITYRDASLRERVYYGHTEMVFGFVSNVVVSFFLAYLGYVLVERPFCILEGMVFCRRFSGSLKDSKVVHNVNTCNAKKDVEIA